MEQYFLSSTLPILFIVSNGKKKFYLTSSNVSSFCNNDLRPSSTGAYWNESTSSFPVPIPASRYFVRGSCMYVHIKMILYHYIVSYQGFFEAVNLITISAIVPNF